MANTRNTVRIKKYGVCLNDKCEKYKQIQEVLHGDMECPECKKKLSPCAPPRKKGNKKLPVIIAGAVVGVAVIAGCFFAFSGDKKDDADAILTDTVPAIDTTKVAAEVKPDTLVKTDTVVVRDTIVKNNTITTSEKVQTKTVVSATTPSKASRTGSATIHLGYANFFGAVKNGKPHGQGRMTFKSSHIIDSRDTKTRVADAGDYVIGEWNNGGLVQGRWYGSDGNVKGSILIGM